MSAQQQQQFFLVFLKIIFKNYSVCFNSCLSLTKLYSTVFNYYVWENIPNFDLSHSQTGPKTKTEFHVLRTTISKLIHDKKGSDESQKSTLTFHSGELALLNTREDERTDLKRVSFLLEPSKWWDFKVEDLMTLVTNFWIS